MTWVSLLIGVKAWCDLRHRLTKLKCFQCWSLFRHIIPAPNELQLDSHPNTFPPRAPFYTICSTTSSFSNNSTLVSCVHKTLSPTGPEQPCGVLRWTPCCMHDLCIIAWWAQISLAVTLGFFHTSLSILCCAFRVLLDGLERATTK